MPIEIRELVIRAAVDPGEAAGGGCGSSKSDEKSKGVARGDSAQGEDMVQNCVREVLRILERKVER
jgi:hypothetical protein